MGGGDGHRLRRSAERPVAFCRVEACPYDPADGYVPQSKDPKRLLRSARDLRGTRGMGAGMALRRHVLTDLGGFDELFGPGARFMSADDVDVAIRVLLRGWHVYETGDRPVIHHGFRTLRQGRDHRGATSSESVLHPRRWFRPEVRAGARSLGVRPRGLAADRRRLAPETTAGARPDHGIHARFCSRPTAPGRCQDAAFRCAAFSTGCVTERGPQFDAAGARKRPSRAKCDAAARSVRRGGQAGGGDGGSGDERSCGRGRTHGDAAQCSSP